MYFCSWRSPRGIPGGQKQYLKKEVLWSAFRVFDKDGDGRITKQELAAILKEQADGEATNMFFFGGVED